MFTLGTHFEHLLETVQPPKARRDQAKELPPKVRDYLETHKDFETLSPHSRLAGSYAQHLCVGDVKDVDFLVRVPGDAQQNEPEAKQLIQNLKTALDGLPKALGQEGCSSIDVQRARRSVHVHFINEGFHIDAVPCIAPNGFDEELFVPDRGFNKWVASHPIGYIDLISKLDEAHHRKVRPLIRLLKHYRNYAMKNRRPKSYWLGALVIYHIQEAESLDCSLSLAQLFRDLCDAVYQQYDHLLDVSEAATPNIRDPLLGHNISWNWERTHFETFMRRLDDGRKWATKALESTDRTEAIGYWQRLFGEDYFPTDLEAAAANQAARGLPGTSYVLGSGLVVSTKPASENHTAIPRTTFHGET